MINKYLKFTKKLNIELTDQLEYFVNEHTVPEEILYNVKYCTTVSDILMLCLVCAYITMILYICTFLYVVLCFAGYVGCLYPFYVLCTVLLKISSATIFDLCVLCANVYNLLFGLFLFNNVVSIFV